MRDAVEDFCEWMIERWGQISWVMEFIDDVKSDMSVFHRLDDIFTLSGPDLFAKAFRLVHYNGAVTFKLRTLIEENEEQANDRYVPPNQRNQEVVEVPLSAQLALDRKSSSGVTLGGGGSYAQVSASDLGE